jgi:hypothetical protein
MLAKWLMDRDTSKGIAITAALCRTAQNLVNGFVCDNYCFGAWYAVHGATLCDQLALDERVVGRPALDSNADFRRVIGAGLLQAQRWSITEIAQMLEVSRQTIHTWIRPNI